MILAFRDKYSTSELVAKDMSLEKKEKDKIILSNDAMAIGEMLELLINTMRGRI